MGRLIQITTMFIHGDIDDDVMGGIYDNFDTDNNEVMMGDDTNILIPRCGNNHGELMILIIKIMR